MELIKKIKQAETEAKEIIENARASTVALAEKLRLDLARARSGAEQERKKAIEDALSEAEAAGLGEVENLKAQAQQQSQQLRDKASARISPTVTKVMDYLRG